MVPQPRRSEGADRTLAAVLQRAAAAQRPWLQTPGDRSPELVGTRYHSPRTHCLIGYKFHTQVIVVAGGRSCLRSPCLPGPLDVGGRACLVVALFCVIGSSGLLLVKAASQAAPYWGLYTHSPPGRDRPLEHFCGASGGLPWAGQPLPSRSKKTGKPPCGTLR